MNDLFMHKEVISRFRQMMFNGIFRPYDIKGEEKIITEKTIVTRPDGKKEEQRIQYKGFEIKGEDKKTYFMKTEDLEKLPFKIKQVKEVIFSRKVYNIITGVETIKISGNPTMPFHEMIDSWFPIKHSNPDDVLVGKFLILTPMLSQSWIRVWTKAGFGKDSLVNSVIGLANYGRKTGVVSPAKMFQLIDEKYTAWNEISSISGERKEMMQNFFFQTADGNDIYEHHSTGNEKTGNKADISRYGYNIFHNNPEYYLNRGQLCFEQIFTNAVVNRVIPFQLEGSIEGQNQYTNLTGVNYDEVLKEAIPFFKQWVGRFYYMEQNYKRFVLHYNISKYDLSDPVIKETTVRWKDSFTKIAILVEQYAVSKYPDNPEPEFYRVMDLIYSRHKLAIQTMKDYNLLE